MENDKNNKQISMDFMFLVLRYLISTNGSHHLGGSPHSFDDEPLPLHMLRNVDVSHVAMACHFCRDAKPNRANFTALLKRG